MDQRELDSNDQHKKTQEQKRLNIWLNQFYWLRFNTKYGSNAKVNRKGKKRNER